MRLVTILVTTALLTLAPAVPVSAQHEVQRLTWAGIRLATADTTVFVDAVGRDIWNGSAPGPVTPLRADTSRRYALVTHLHNDHFDPDSLRQVLGDRGYVICHRSVAAHVASRGLRVIPADEFVPLERGGFSITAVPAEDGFGDEQVSWIIDVDGRRYFHAGDTLWHGRWAYIGRHFGPFDTAFLPVNGARLGGDVPVRTAAVMTPTQAVDAARLLRARRLVPIHYGYSDPPGYVEVERPVEQVMSAARDAQLAVQVLQPGDVLQPER